MRFVDIFVGDTVMIRGICAPLYKHNFIYCCPRNELSLMTLALRDEKNSQSEDDKSFCFRKYFILMRNCVSENYYLTLPIILNDYYRHIDNNQLNQEVTLVFKHFKLAVACKIDAP